MSPNLKQFYRDLDEWCDTRSNEAHFLCHVGICANLCYWVSQNSLYDNTLGDELAEQFIDAGLHPYYPFNPSATHFMLEKDCYLNPVRRSWIASHARGKDLKIKV